MQRLTSEAKNVLCECAEYQLANSPTHDHVAAHILRQLGDGSGLTTVPEDDYFYDDENEDCYEWYLISFYFLKYIYVYVYIFLIILFPSVAYATVRRTARLLECR